MPVVVTFGPAALRGLAMGIEEERKKNGEDFDV